MDMKSVLEAFNYKIVGGAEQLWNCYGRNARFLDFESDFAHGSCVFDIDDQFVYEVEVSSKNNSVKPYRWIDHRYRGAYNVEAKEHGTDPNVAWDNVNWVDCETEEDILDKVSAIMCGEDFDDRVDVPLDLDNDVMLTLALEAHRRDITLNQLVTEVLEVAVERELSQKENNTD